ncbi:MAG: MarR family transcriptional regulator [Chloroflexi bacterium]|nr:MarR family transcriptional regulator [Chloroflexota bacterium]
MNEKSEMIDRILGQVEGAFRELLPRAHQELLDLDLTTPQLKVVLLVYLNGPARMSDLASSLGVTLATATGIVDRLVDRDIVERENSREDRRVVVCRLSAKGHELTDRLYTSGRERARQLLQGLDEDILSKLDEALASLTGAGVGKEKK